ncbi:alpha-(1-_3)-arabinofuranosyltransferase family protein, partial [Streptomyces sp. GC420]|uniref:alpha-(1->3)-arabinofuranosyltransferase domain-containing protein n=1 Tax=Streptomyces sp. GC420 TaxID=2697568 RepID=UPI001414DE8A
PDGPRGRRWLLGFWALVFVAFLAAAPGKIAFDTKLGVATDPFGFLSDLGELWQDQAGFGGIYNQYVGYAFPMLPYYALTDLLHIPVWLAERLWLSLVVSAAFWGALRLAERLGTGNGPSRLVGAAAYALWPVYTVVVGSTSAAALPGAMLPWVLLPLAGDRTAPRIAAARSALLIPFMGGVNAASTLAALLPVGLYLLSRPASPRKWRLIGWWVPGVVLATLWWVIPLLLLGSYGENWLPYVEQADTTTATMSATEVLRGAGNWVGYLHFGEAWLPAGWAVVSSVFVVLCSALAAALGLAGLARRDLPERRWLVLTVLVVVLVTLAGYAGSAGAPFSGTVQGWLDGLLRPFRNVYKFQPGLALALVLGLTHVTAVAARERGARRVRGRRFVPLVVGLLVLPGLAWPYLNGDILQPGTFKALPSQWKRAADWLEGNSPDSRALVVPATAHGIYTWGTTVDQPLDVLAGSRWAQRDYVPFGQPGARRAMDAVEQALLTGTEVPGLSDYLSRAGLYYVVVRNDLDPDQLGYVPPQTVKRTLESSGYRRVAEFGPLLTSGRIPPETPLQVAGLYPRERAVEIYAPPSAAERPGQAGLKPVAGTAVVSGGPEALLQLSADPEMRDRPAVLTGDNHPGVGDPAVRAVADGLRRADTRFGLVNTNTSYTYTRDERNLPGSFQDAGEEPRQILPSSGVSHQTVAELRGAKSVTASSSGNWLFHLPQYDPVNAFDGNPATAWAEGTAGEPVGQWVRVEFDEPVDMPASIEVTPLAGNALRAAPTEIRISTDQGFEDSPLQTDGSRQSVKAPKGRASWLKAEIRGSQAARAGLTGAGFAEISVPDVQVTRLLALPGDAADDGSDSGSASSGASAEIFSMHRATDPGGLTPATSETGLHRKFTATSSGAYAAEISALPVAGEALDRLLYEVAPEQERRITATADSTAALGTSLTPRNLMDGDLTTAWIAGDKPVLHLSWPGEKVEIDEIVLAAAGGVSARPEQIEISSPDGAAIASVDENGQARFPGITTNRLDITITRTAPLTVHHPLADGRLQLPVGLSEVYVPALEELRSPQPDPDAEFALPCGKGPVLAIGGELHATKASGLVRDLNERRPVKVELCAGQEKDGSVQLGRGEHVVEAGDEGPLAVTDVTLTRGTVETPPAADRELTVEDWAGDRRAVRVGTGTASYLTMYGNANDGWKATLDGEELSSVRLDGWQQGWLVPQDSAGTIKLEYEPARWYEAGLIVAGIALLGLLALAFVRRSGAAPAEPGEAGEPLPGPPAPGAVLGTVVLTLVLIVVAGPWALLVPALAVLAYVRRSALVPLALFAMLGAGVTAALGAGEAPAADEGPFHPVAQVLALLALTAAIVTLPRRDPAPPPAAPAPPGPGTDPAATAVLPVTGAPADPAAPLPQRTRPPGPEVAAGPPVQVRGPGAERPPAGEPDGGTGPSDTRRLRKEPPA